MVREIVRILEETDQPRPGLSPLLIQPPAFLDEAITQATLVRRFPISPQRDRQDRVVPVIDEGPVVQARLDSVRNFVVHRLTMINASKHGVPSHSRTLTDAGR
jgi:hypothetical protein